MYSFYIKEEKDSETRGGHTEIWGEERFRRRTASAKALGEGLVIKIKSPPFILICTHIFLLDWPIIRFSGEYQCQSVLNEKVPDNLKAALLVPKIQSTWNVA